MDVAEARAMALQRPGVEEYEHFGKPAYRVAPKKAGGRPGRTFMTLWLDEGHAVLMLDLELQEQLLEEDERAYRPHPSKWGAKGATIAELRQLSTAAFNKAIDLAHRYALR